MLQSVGTILRRSSHQHIPRGRAFTVPALPIMAASTTPDAFVDPLPLMTAAVLRKRDVVVALTVPAPSISALLGRVGGSVLGKHEPFSFKPVHPSLSTEIDTYRHALSSSEQPLGSLAPLRTVLLSQAAVPIPGAAAWAVDWLCHADHTKIDSSSAFTAAAAGIAASLGAEFSEPARSFVLPSPDVMQSQLANVTATTTDAGTGIVLGAYVDCTDAEAQPELPAEASAEAADCSAAPSPSIPPPPAAAGSSVPSSASAAGPSRRKQKRRVTRKQGSSRQGQLPAVVGLSLRMIERRASDGTMSMDEVWDAVLPPAGQVPRPSAFEAAGHVARVNLSPEQWAWRRVIGACLLMRHGALRTVVAKTDAIDGGSVFRTLPLEIVAGEGLDGPVEPLWVRLRESGCVFELDYRAVYWNSRLSTEHRRLSDEIHARATGQVASVAAEPVSGPASGADAPSSTKRRRESLGDRAGSRVLDLTCGVGPFAVPLSREGLWVRANDLNPASIASCVANGHRNGVDARLAPWGGADLVEAAARDASESLKAAGRSREEADAAEHGGSQCKRAAAEPSADARLRPWARVERAAAGRERGARLLCSCEDAGAAVRRAGGTMPRPIPDGPGGGPGAGGGSARESEAWPYAVAVSNLPDRGMRVLRSFHLAIDAGAWGFPATPLPRICVYCFARSEGARPTLGDVELGVRRRAAMALDPRFHRACVAARTGAAPGLPPPEDGAAEALLDDVPAFKPRDGDPPLPAWAAAGGSGRVTVRGVRDVSPRKLMVLVEIASPPASLLCAAV